MTKRERQQLETLAGLLHHAVNGGLDMAGRKAPLGQYKHLMREVRDELSAIAGGRK